MIFRFVVGGAAVCFFSALGDILKPKSFAGLLGAAPSVALATLSLTLVKDGHAYAQLEARSMVLGGLAFFFYASLVAWLLVRSPAVRKRFSVLAVASSSLVVWITSALGLLYIVLRR
jgi:uncharacterized protein DUF3147